MKWKNNNKLATEREILKFKIFEIKQLWAVWKSRVYPGLYIGNKESLCRELKESRQILKSAKINWILTMSKVLREKVNKVFPLPSNNLYYMGRWTSMHIWEKM